MRVPCTKADLASVGENPIIVLRGTKFIISSGRSLHWPVCRSVAAIDPSSATGGHT